MEKVKELELRTLSSLAKVFSDKIYGERTRICYAAKGAEISFQIAYRSIDRAAHRYPCDYKLCVRSALSGAISLFRVENVVSTFPAYLSAPDSQLITKRPGIFPDPLIPMADGELLHVSRDIWHSLWISVNISEDTDAGQYPVTVDFIRKGRVVDSATITVLVHNVTLPVQKLMFTQWFHCDCIADIHGVKVFSEKHWRLIDSYMQLAARHGVNVIFTPILTPPLDTAEGMERPTVQLVDIERTEDRYKFDFSRLGRYIEIANKNGIHRFEINHMFTQWGAAHAPKVVARVNGRKKRIFGWDTKAASIEYANFLRALIPALMAAFAEHGVGHKDLFFHVSDEPHIEHLENYRAASNILLPLIEGSNHIDALSNIEFYRNGLIKTPVSSTTHATEFINEGVQGLWCYYYCGTAQTESNRFFSMPLSRTRDIGVQMYRAGVAGFLHWGYNFYYTQFSSKLINPYLDTSGGDVFPGGDAFSVYPYGDRAIPSMRLKVFANALDDVRLLYLLEERIGRKAVVELIDGLAGREVNFDYCPCDEKYYDRLYSKAFEYLES